MRKIPLASYLIVYFIMCVLGFISFTFAQISNSSVDQAVLQNILTHLTKTNKISIDFTQVDSNGQKAYGKILIEKPYKFRFHYYTPLPLLIIGNKNYVSIYDYQMNQTTKIKASENMLNLLLSDNLNIEQNKDLMIEKAQDEGEYLILQITNVKLEKSIIFTFSKKLQQIVKLEILESDQVTEVFFDKTDSVDYFDHKIFKFIPPKQTESLLQMNKDEIEKFIHLK